ncbi:ABC transporter ATP-binding protein [Geodermatophilus obscurus]|uniref:ABC transporter related protein n=1 Tax=Geodermatophilus obscurus (strain ATCC 25078 / DSM 43160 / JCM 3152 / CCUG 61914 / KCC A-0152 / KCTC 9177 / NBRC 13315 / NRRL B-3577 / G-20) TaxID=526225 RepID=D2S7T1_GEOOG|nr:ABC transporter ATP-binding protein [Geodermatophilus obscurus]ADB75540.1 ABC transporter related protein [Geodermatophilus obscurus DSM 43160]
MATTSSSVHALRAHELSKRFGATEAVADLSLDVAPGAVFGFLGPNGAGKSTTIRLLLGLLRPTAGTAEVFGVPAADVKRAHRLLAYVPADVALWPSLTGRECLDLLAGVGPGTDLGYRKELLERFALDPDRRARTYSTGNRQKVALVAAFATRAPLLVLDEPTSGLDPLMEREFRACIAEAAARGQTVFLSSHLLAEVQAVCSRVGILRSGRLVEVAGLEELRRLRRMELVADLAAPAPGLQRLAALPEVTGLRWPTPVRLELSLSGPPGAVLRALADADVTRLEVREPSLEEIFLDYYGEVPA